MLFEILREKKATTFFSIKIFSPGTIFNCLLVIVRKFASQNMILDFVIK